MKKTAMILWLRCLAGSLAVLPYVFYLGIIPEEVSWLQLVLGNLVQSAVLYGSVCWLSCQIVPRTDLEPFTVAKGSLLAGLIWGVMAGLGIRILDGTIFGASMLSETHPPFWAGALASLYGGINEEVLLRFFFFSAIYWLVGKLFHFQRLTLLWLTNVIVALVFGIGHMPAAFQLVSSNVFEVTRILVLNGFPGLIFGWLYCGQGGYLRRCSPIL